MVAGRLWQKAAVRCAPWTRPEDDRVLLVLRLDRQLPWEEIAEVMLGEENPTRAALTKESARLRKRFQLLKEKLPEQVVASGLLDR